MEAFPERNLKKRKLCENRIKYVVLPFDEFNIPGFSDNPPIGVIYVKSIVRNYQAFKSPWDDCVADGSNLDDLLDYRPGMKAVRSGYCQSFAGGRNDEMISVFYREMGLSTWNKPSFACLASRFLLAIRLPGKNAYGGSRRRIFNQFRV